ncbi:multifunctional oxoglutarate decarboxylase/oxoglutarate dehydrogenase thiamine pyrophosphate-binding subunit/dihydrolipoyllysine-residue succinyltransferase subunit [Leptolyngbya sp. 7M]|uniref:multifunctional oxoglutarate decarboxylase/oxoglutarate dehydrogenase thiamine pyrophosphate-binding subunit/dihydrolipoyllysine-residue succinyltransferase subunit n=1 Tax=Leptolyngbya sp. 7M TaxID=2812896 RepID=UPI001B8AA382|nr:multifunctional oxoglutarate decarboxylase/oxoglutarate dehydrogenase thiamine pyrophosphate-binding subunit/dihydrolipoyllysine-residue succinyltransferase subunit [Leptolyngbya sp. 7M]QYO66171.1 multifunctional oxoglutarate decarboxylase/oxoglutarate dehydrogenase thiamine pyrophosphate-binding subunit/dihydrolipoyllysine-residue succinyltransferase subunit [Leptolyngbya sp. 7M]
MSNPITNISEHFEANFGANSSYVEALFARFKEDPTSVDESWQVYFGEMLAGTDGTTNAASRDTERGQTTLLQETKKENTEEAVSVSKTESIETPVLSEGSEAKPLVGPAKKIVENMEQSLSVPTATSVRTMPVKLLEENRRIINQHLATHGGGKVSFTHLIAWAIVRSARNIPAMNNGFGIVDGKPARIVNSSINLGIAIDIEKRDGTRNLLVPNIKECEKKNFSEFLSAYNDAVKRARDGKLEISDFQGTTISLTNPGTIGTGASNPRLMSGQSAIIATGAIEYPAEYQAMTTAALSQLGISKTITLTSTYDHRVIQGAESGLFLAYIHELLLGQHGFYEEIFADLEINHSPLRWSEDFNPSLFGGDRIAEQTEKQANVLQLINAYRIRGHLLADIDPLNMTGHREAELELENFGLTIWDLDREFITGGLHGEKTLTLRKILDILRKAYCGKVGIEYRHIQSKEEKEWIRGQIRQHFVDQTPLEPELRKDLLQKLIEAEQFEQFLHKKYLGQKRFSLEGCETVIPMLDQLVEGAGARGIEEIFMGMAHRGRLNVLSNIVGDAESGDMAERIFTVFEGTSHPSFPADEGDVKYHQGALGVKKTKSGNSIKIQLSCNPSHLEFVNPVVEGMARGRQDDLRNGDGRTREEVYDLIMPVLLHGDAAFAGQGIVMETLQLANLPGYRTGGTIHIVINNQIGFTTGPESGRSSIYSTDAGQITQTPIFHINGDDPEAAFRVIQIALDYRHRFNKDVVLDLVGFRRLGHNEGDEPSYTQPVMYARVKAHPGTRHLYAQYLIREGVITEDELKTMTDKVVDKYEGILSRAKQIASEKPKQLSVPEPVIEEDGSTVFETGASSEHLQTASEKISLVPAGFNINPKMVGQLGRRAKMGAGEVPMDWGFAEAMAIGTLVQEGYPVRLSGQDSGRGTFSQRHASMYDTVTGERWSPLTELRNPDNGKARFYVFDSSLSEAGVLGFEYGYSLICQNDLVMWEAQFGDFANGAQVIIDQYISASEDKWKERCRLVMLLPHGYEGQGPEHSSARLERFLQLCAENNLQVCNPTTPAQYFHLLRRQVKQETIRPLVVMTPKSLLRLPAASSTIEELRSGGFRPVVDDAKIKDRSLVKRIVLCSGKVYYDLDAGRGDSGDDRVAIVRLEQFYPFPGEALREIIAGYPNAVQLFWVQEEPQNMGGWFFVEPRLRKMMPETMSLRYVGRVPSASPATGSYAIHELEQKEIVDNALIEDTDEISAASEPEVSEKIAPASA